MDEFDDFVFFDELRDELNVYDKHPEQITRALCFHGLPGIGKTSFAKYLARKHASQVLLLDMNHRTHPFFKDWRREIAMRRFTDQEIGWDEPTETKKKHFDYAVIFDEWNDAKFDHQNKWKVPIEEMYSKYDVLVIICMNTSHYEDKESRRFSLEKMLSPAIASRCDVVEFSPYDEDKNQVINEFRRRYPKLTERKLLKAYPDIRSMVHIGERSKKGF